MNVASSPLSLPPNVTANIVVYANETSRSDTNFRTTSLDFQ